MDKPWHFNCASIVFEEPGLDEVSKLLFRYTDFWVQVHNVPIACMSERMGLQLGNLIGEVLELDGGATGLCLENFLRIKIRVDVFKLLRKAINVVLKTSREPVTVFLSYERLPDFCLNCSMLDHILRECSLLPSKWKYGSSLRAISLGR